MLFLSYYFASKGTKTSSSGDAEVVKASGCVL